MLRALLLASLLLASTLAASGQAVGVLQIKIVMIDAERNATPVPNHALLISDNPPSAPPRRIVTARDGTATVRLRPGNYTVESDRPVAFQGRSYQWTERVDIAAGGDAVLELTVDNADVEPVASATATSAQSLDNDPSFLLPRWQASVVAIWTPTGRASGFVVDTKGLIATNQRLIGPATEVEVQLTPEVKVTARVVAADPARDVAVLWIDPMVAASVRPVPLGCGQAARPSVVAGQELFTISAPLREQKAMTPGTIIRVEPQSILSDFRLPLGGTGGPVFTAGGGVVGMTSLVADSDESARRTFRVVRVDAACDVVASAEQKTKDAAPPAGTHLPVEPRRPFPTTALKAEAQRRMGSLSPPRMASSDFDVAFITPVPVYGAHLQAGQAQGTPGGGSEALRSLRDFSNWSEYVADFHPVLLIRVTPRLVESIWATIARGAVLTQGAALPPIKQFKSGFSRMRTFCGDAEVTPIHPFKLERRVSETDAIYEGLYIFDPGALGPHCGTVKLVLYSEKEPEKGDTRLVDPKVLQRIWQDFAPYRELG